jgi:hypothetical protein
MKAHELIAQADKWCQNNPAINSEGKRVQPWDESACAWCPNGAIDKCYGDTPEAEAASLRVAGIIAPDKNTDFVSGIYIAQWNDEPARTHAEVLAVLQKADA